MMPARRMMSAVRVAAPLATLLPALGACVEPAHLEREWSVLDRPVSAEVWATTQRTAELLLSEFPEATERVEAMMAPDRL